MRQRGTEIALGDQNQQGSRSGERATCWDHGRTFCPEGDKIKGNKLPERQIQPPKLRMWLYHVYFEMFSF